MEPFIGEIKMVGFNFAPRGYATCQGQLMSIAQNTALFSLLGTTFGGNGQTTFGLPDFQGRSPVGQGSGGGLTPITQGEMAGTESVTILTAQMPMHTHVATTSIAIPAGTANGTTKTPANNTFLATTNDSAAGAEVTLYATGTPDTTLQPFNPTITVGTAGGNQPLPLRNPYLGTMFIIALEGVFPSRS